MSASSISFPSFFFKNMYITIIETNQFVFIFHSYILEINKCLNHLITLLFMQLVEERSHIFYLSGGLCMVTRNSSILSLGKTTIHVKLPCHNSSMQNISSYLTFFFSFQLLRSTIYCFLFLILLCSKKDQPLLCLFSKWMFFFDFIKIPFFKDETREHFLLNCALCPSAHLLHCHLQTIRPEKDKQK